MQAVVADKADTFTPMTVVMGGTVYGIMGTDGLGRDIWQGLLYGFPIGLLIATLAALLSTLIGASLGILSGYAGGALDTVIQRASDIVSNVPVLPLLIFLVSVLGRHLWLIVLILVAFSWPGLTILVRSMVLQLRSGPTGRSGAGARRLARPDHAPPHLSAGGALHRRPDDLFRARARSWPKRRSPSSAWATRRSRPGARCWKPASAPARSTSATGGGSCPPAS